MNEELLKHAKAVHYELITLAPRLDEPFASNVRAAIVRAEIIVDYFEGENDEH